MSDEFWERAIICAATVLLVLWLAPSCSLQVRLVSEPTQEGAR